MKIAIIVLAFACNNLGWKTRRVEKRRFRQLSYERSGWMVVFVIVEDIFIFLSSSSSSSFYFSFAKFFIFGTRFPLVCYVRIYVCGDLRHSRNWYVPNVARFLSYFVLWYNLKLIELSPLEVRIIKNRFSKHWLLRSALFPGDFYSSIDAERRIYQRSVE